MPDGTAPDAFQNAAQGGGPFPAQLLLWLSPAFPVGGFAFSQGLECAVEKGWVRDGATLRAWLEDLLSLGSVGNDLALLAAAWRAVTLGDDALLREVAELAVALQPSAERHLEAVTEGGAFMAQIKASWPCGAAARLEALRGEEVAYATAVAVATAGHGIALGPTLTAYGLAVAGNFVSAAVRLGVVGQTEGQRVLALLLPAVESAAERARTGTLDDLGSACWRADLACAQHETQHTRLFRS